MDKLYFNRGINNKLIDRCIYKRDIMIGSYICTDVCDYAINDNIIIGKRQYVGCKLYIIELRKKKISKLMKTHG